jgi:CheY-like chemotaxis protein
MTPMSVPAPRPILLVADPESLAHIRSLLAHDGFSVRTVTDAERALRAIREEAPRLVITDLGLPGIDGVGFIRRVKADPSTRGISIVALTADDAVEEQTRLALGAGAAVCCAKPVQAETFRRLIQAVVAADGATGGA